VLDDGTSVVGRAVLIATGMSWRRLAAPGIDDLVNAGVYYGTSLVEASLREAALSEQLTREVAANDRITVRCGVEIGEARGYGRLEKVVLLDIATGKTEIVTAGSLYVLVGTVPLSGWVKDVVGLDEFGFVLTGTEVARRAELLPAPWPLDRPALLTETSVPGVFAAGDVRAGSVKRIGSAVGQGAVAVAAVSQYLDTLDDDGLAEQPYDAPPFDAALFEATGPFETPGLDNGIPGQGLLGDAGDLLGEEIDED
jgi:thioredoxin reductase (NADPH)